MEYCSLSKLNSHSLTRKEISYRLLEENDGENIHSPLVRIKYVLCFKYLKPFW